MHPKGLRFVCKVIGPVKKERERQMPAEGASDESGMCILGWTSLGTLPTLPAQFFCS